MRTILTAAALAVVATPAFAQVTRITEPVPASDPSVISAPIEYDSNGVAKAQYFKAEDLTPEQLDALLAEADRVRGYQQSNGVYVRPETAAAPEAYTSPQTYVAAPVTIHSPAPIAPAAPYAGTYEIELYEAPAVSTAQVHTVVKGDTLYNISKRYAVTIDALRSANGVSGNAISLGQSLEIPGSAPTTMSLNTTAPATTVASAQGYTGYVTERIVEPVPNAAPVQAVTADADTVYAVLPKDTLYAISRRTCVKVPALIAANGITDANTLKPGQKLTIPAGHCLTN